MHKQLGIGLLDLSVSLFLAMLLWMILAQHYIQIKSYYIHAEASIESDTELALVENNIATTVRRAGFTPCARIDHLNTMPLWSPITLLQNEEKGFQVNRMSEAYGLVDYVSATQLLLPDDFVLKKDKPLLISDCYHGEIINNYRTDDINGRKSIIPLSPLHFVYVAPVYLGEWIKEQFFMREKKLFYDAGQPEVLSTEVVIHRVMFHNDRLDSVLSSGKKASIIWSTKIRS